MINSYFTNNTANRDGGAINMDSGTVSNCNFTNNNATEGGAVYFVAGSTGNVISCNFDNNTAKMEVLLGEIVLLPIVILLIIKQMQVLQLL